MNTYLIGCPHFGQDSIYWFKNDQGDRIRPYANNAAEGDKFLLDRWNQVVKPEDRVYVMGDLSMNRRSISLIAEANGRKKLVKGNHDIFKLKDYLPYFDDILATHKLGDFILSHIPIHRESIPRWCRGNIHAHIHWRKVMLDTEDGPVEDPLYFNTCVECIDFRPISFNDICKEFDKRRLSLSQS